MAKVNIAKFNAETLRYLVSLPHYSIEECGSWWKFVDSDEEFTIIQGAPQNQV